MRDEEFRELSAGHALNALSEEEERTLAGALEEQPERHRTLDEDLRTAASLALTTPPQQPPPDLRARILQSATETPQEPASATETPQEPVRRSRSRRLRMSMFALAASVVLILAIAIGPRLFESAQEPSPAVVAMQEIEAAGDARSATADVEGGGMVTLHWSVSAGSAVIETGDLPTIAEDKAYELWFVRGAAPISAGLVDYEQDSDFTLLAGELNPGDVVAVTIEGADGSPTGEPTSDPIVAIETD